jgi:hypothetical protein
VGGGVGKQRKTKAIRFSACYYSIVLNAHRVDMYRRHIHDLVLSSLKMKGIRFFLYVLFYVLFVCKCVRPPGDNPIAVNKYIIYHITIMVAKMSTHT